MTLPTLFISHGAPTFALDPGELGPRLRALAAGLPTPRAILALSPHWMTRGLQINTSSAPETIHDFGGFPRPLYQLQYPAPGSAKVAAEVMEALGHQGIAVVANPNHGIDHGVWVPLVHMYPNADVAVVQISQPAIPSPLALLELGQALAQLRELGVLVYASGSLTHNLYAMGGGEPARERAALFGTWMWEHLRAGDLDALLDYRTRAPHAAWAHPTDEHLLPLFFALGAAGEAWSHVRRLDGGITYDAIQMDSYAFGAAGL